MNWADQEYAIGRGIAAIRHKRSKHLQPFVRAAIESQLAGLLQAATGSTFPNVAAAQLADIPIPDIDGETQSALASVLGALDDKIDLNRRMNETLEGMARAIFKDWFVDFGPVRAKAEGRQPPGLAPDIAALFPDKLDDDDKPMGWARGTLGSIATVNPESWSAASCPESVDYVDLANTKWGMIESTVHYDWDKAPSRARRILRSGDTIIGTVRPGNGSFAPIGREGLTGSTGFAVLRPKQPHFREILYYAATSPENIERLSHLADGAAYPAVRPEIVAATELIIASEAIATIFFQLTAPYMDRVEANKQENRTLSALRDLLLLKLMSGEVRLKEGSSFAQGAA